MSSRYLDMYRWSRTRLAAVTGLSFPVPSPEQVLRAVAESMYESWCTVEAVVVERGGRACYHIPIALFSELPSVLEPACRPLA